MDDPYKTLGLTPSATEDEVKAAYKKLAKQYHPDLNQSSAYAEQRMKEINEAYTQIMKGDKGNAAYTSRTSWYGGESAGTESSAKLTAARNYINAGYYREALNVLMAMEERTARWFYYAAIAHSGLNNRTQALEFARRAVAMEPGNFEYQNLIDQLEMGARRYQQYGRGFNMPNINMSGICATLCFAQLCCPYCRFPILCC